MPRSITSGLLGAALLLSLSACHGWDGLGPGHPLTVEVTPSNLTLDVGEAEHLTATVSTKGGRDVGAWAEWSSSDPSVASVDASGLVTAVSPGTATITATVRSYSGSAGVVVSTPAPVPVIHFPLDGNATDVSGNGRNGTIFGTVTPTAGARGVASGAMEFDGATGFIEFGNLDLPGAFTLAAWIRPTAHADGTLRGGIVGKFTLPGNWEFNVNESSSQIVAHTSTTAGLFSPAPVVADTWVHVVATYDGASTLRIYLDGALVASGSGYAPAPSSPGLPRIARSTWGGNPFKGAIDDVRVYDVELSSSDVTDLFAIAGS